MLKILIFSLIGYCLITGVILFWFHAASVVTHHDEQVWEKIMKDLTQRKNR